METKALQSLLQQGRQPPSLVFWQRLKSRQRGGKKGNFQIWPDWRLLAQGSCRKLWGQLEVRHPVSLVQVHICLSLIGLRLEVGTKVREVVSY